MRSTRSSSKRLSSENLETPHASSPKKRKYQVPSDSSSSESWHSSDDNDGKMRNCGVVENLNLSEDSDSECSENENKSKIECKITLASPTLEETIDSELKVDENHFPMSSYVSGDSAVEEKPVQSEYFDFTEILQTHKAALELSQHTSALKEIETKQPSLEEKKRIDSGRKSARNKNKSIVKNKTTKLREKFEDTDNSKGSISSGINSLSVAELLLIGENITDDKDMKQLKAEVPEGNKREDLEITIALPDLPSNSKKKKRDLKEIMRLRLNAKRREIQIFMHKVHLLVWIAHGNHINTVLNSQDLLGVALSLIPSKHSYPPKHLDIDYLEKLTKFFRKKILINPDFVEGKTLTESLLKSFESKETLNNKFLIFMFICVLRALGLQCRLVLNLVPVPLKPPQEDLLTAEKMSAITTDTKKSNARPNATSSKIKPGECKSTKTLDGKKKNKKYGPQTRKLENKNSSGVSKDSVKIVDSFYFSSGESTRSKSKSVCGRPVENCRKKKNDEKPKGRKGFDDSHQSSVSKRNRRKQKSANQASCSKDSDSLLVEEDFTSEEESESETFSTPKRKICRKVLSTDDEEYEVPKKSKYKKPVKQGLNVWAEVFAEAEEKWLSVDVVSTKIHVTQQLRNGATHPVAYVLAWNDDHSIKDVTRRYVPNYNSAAKKFRVESTWIEETLQPYRCANNARNKEEDEDLDRLMQDQPKPLSIQEYKNHPLYVLKRHLLKFEAIYPPDAPSLGFIKNEPIYARECVKELHSRETWLKEAKLVRIKETPYKIVKARPKYDRMSGTVKTDIPLELFGEWQTEDYMPPIAKDGIVPRNAYGNVDLFKPRMLPVGTAYIELPGVYRIARKLNIDCAAAVTGFDFHSGGSHPVIGGYVVCEEFKDVILDAWNEEADNAAKKEEEKRLARVYKNWRRLIKGALILNRVKLRYMKNEE